MTVSVSFSEVFSYLFAGGAIALLLTGVGFEIFDAEKRRLVPQNRILKILRWFVPSLLCFEDRKDMQSLCRFTAIMAVGCILLSAYMMTKHLCNIGEVPIEAKLWIVYVICVATTTWVVYVVTMVIKLALTLLKVIISFIKG